MHIFCIMPKLRACHCIDSSVCQNVNVNAYSHVSRRRGVCWLPVCSEWVPCVLVQCVEVNIRFLLAILKWGAGNIFVRSQTRVASNLHVVCLMSKFCKLSEEARGNLWQSRDKMVFFYNIKVYIILLIYFQCFVLLLYDNYIYLTFSRRRSCSLKMK